MIISTTIPGRHETVPLQATSHLPSASKEGALVSKGDGLAGHETARAREVREGKSSDLPELLSGLETAYTEGNGPPGQGKNAAKNAEAQQQVSQNAQAGEKALEGAGLNLAELGRLDSHAQEIKSVPNAGPKGEMAPEASSEVGPRAGEQPRPRSAQLPEKLQEQGEGRHALPDPQRGDTSDRIQVEAGPAGSESLRSELDAQRRQKEQQTQGRESATRVKSDLGRQASEIDLAKQNNGQELQEQSQELQKGQQNLNSDQQTVDRSQRGVQEARARVSKDESQVQQDQTIVDQDQAHVSQAQTSVTEAQTEVGKADEMTQQADQRVQRAQELKPGNGQGGGDAQGAQGKGQGQGGNAGPAKGKGASEGGGGGPKGQGNGNGVVWKRALASAQDFRQKAAKRKASSTKRQQSAQRNVETAQSKLQRDREGLAQSQGHLTRSQANLGVRDSDLQTANTNLRASRSAVDLLQKNLENLGIRGKALESKQSDHKENLRLLEINHEFLGGNIEKGGRNIALLERELEKQPLAREVKLEELKETGSNSSKLKNGATPQSRQF